MPALAPVRDPRDETIETQIAEFSRCHLNTLTKVALVEMAWKEPDATEVIDRYINILGSATALAAVRTDLEELVRDGIFIPLESTVYLERYRLTEDSDKRAALDHLLSLWDDPRFRSRAVAQLRYRAA